MRYAIFSDIHANLEALQAVLAKIDAISEQQPIDEIWFLGDLVGYGPNPNECITLLRGRTNVIIAGNHDWAAVGNIDLEDFSSAARISAEWTAEQLTEEHKKFLAELPERIEIEDVTLVHGSPFGPLWEYLTTEMLAERSFQEFISRYCFVGHTHVPVIFQQPDTIAEEDTHPLSDDDELVSKDTEPDYGYDDEDTVKMVAITPMIVNTQIAESAESAYADPATGAPISEENANKLLQAREEQTEVPSLTPDTEVKDGVSNASDAGAFVSHETPEAQTVDANANIKKDPVLTSEAAQTENDVEEVLVETTPESQIQNAEERLNSEIEELLELLGLSESMVQVTNEMFSPPEGKWELPRGYRAIINPGGVGQPRDGDPRAAFMIYDTEKGFEFYRVTYELEKTQEKIVKAGLPPYLAVRLSYGR